MPKIIISLKLIDFIIPSGTELQIQDTYRNVPVSNSGDYEYLEPNLILPDFTNEPVQATPPDPDIPVGHSPAVIHTIHDPEVNAPMVTPLNHGESGLSHLTNNNSDTDKRRIC